MRRLRPALGREWLLGLVCVLLAVAVSADPEPFRLPVPLTAREIRLETRDIAYDPHSGRIFASSGPKTAGRANSITALDPRTGNLEPPVFIGSDPGRLAVAPDGSSLYVLLEGAAAIARFDIRTRKPVSRFDIGRPHLEDMLVPAGHPNWVVVARQNPGYSPRHAGGSLFVDGREIRLYQWGPNVFIPTPDGDRLYGVYNELGPGKIGRRPIGLEGPGQPEGFSISEEEGSQFLVEEGKLFSNSGRIYDFKTGQLLGRCGRGGQFVAAQEKNHRVYYLRSTEKGLRFQVYDTRTFVPGDWLDISGVKGRVTRLVKYDADSYAFRTEGGQVFLIQPTAAAGKVAAPPPSPGPGKDGARPGRAPASKSAVSLVASWAAVSEVTGVKGVSRNRLSARFVLRNEGEAPAPRCGIRFYLSERATLSGKEVALQRTSLPPIPSADTLIVPLDLELPSGTSTAGRYLVAVLDRAALDQEAGQVRHQIAVGPLP